MWQSILPWCRARLGRAESLCPLEVAWDATQGFLAVRRTLSDSNAFLGVLGRQQGDVQRERTVQAHKHALVCRDEPTS